MGTITQQPGLRSFIVYDRLPAGCIAFPVTDEQNMPHLRPGDVAVIDPTDHAPAVGELFVIRWSSSGRSEIVETWKAMRAGYGPSGTPTEVECWKVGGSSRPRSYAELCAWLAAGKVGGWVDGPYPTEGPQAGQLSQKLRGRVVGILETAFAEPRRLSSAEGR